MLKNKNFNSETPYSELLEEQHEGAITLTLPEDEIFADASVLFSIMADGTRLKIIWLLCQGEYCVFDIAATVKMSAPAISHHLRSLRQLDLIEYRRSGKHVLYSMAKNYKSDFIKKTINDVFSKEDIKNE